MEGGSRWGAEAEWVLEIFWGVGGCSRVDGKVGIGEGFLTGDPIGIGGGSEHDERFEGQLC